MQNTNHVCWKCRTCNRHGGSCVECGKPTHRILDKYRVPTKNKIKEWEALREDAVNLNKFHQDNYQTWLGHQDE